MLNSGNSSAWQGLINGPLYSNSRFRQFDTVDDVQGTYSDDASLVGAMTLFLDGIVPDTGYLAINASEERCQDNRTCFPISEWQFNYQNHNIRIPVMKGNLTFIFGSQNVSQDFTSNTVYNGQFTSDWNNITSTTRIADINTVTLQPVTLHTMPRPPPTPSPSPTPSVTPTPTPINQTNSPTPTQNPPTPQRIGSTEPILYHY